MRPKKRERDDDAAVREELECPVSPFAVCARIRNAVTGRVRVRVWRYVTTLYALAGVC